MKLFGKYKEEQDQADILLSAKEIEIYQRNLKLDNALKSFKNRDIWVELEKGDFQKEDTDVSEVEDIEIDHEAYEEIDFTYTGEITYEAEAHPEQQWCDLAGDIETLVIDKVYPNIIGFEGTLTASIGGEIRSKKFWFGA
jgi:hypothetical protein